MIINNLDKAKEILDRIPSRLVVNPGQYIFQKSEGYNVVQQAPIHKDEPSISTLDIPVTKRQRLEKGESSKVELYSPSQSPLRLDDEQVLRRELR